MRLCSVSESGTLVLHVLPTGLFVGKDLCACVSAMVKLWQRMKTKRDNLKMDE